MISDWNEHSLSSTSGTLHLEMSPFNWVKGVHEFKLKCRNIWDVEYTNSDSWSWKVLVEFRNKVRPHTQHILGDGKVLMYGMIVGIL